MLKFELKLFFLQIQVRLIQHLANSCTDQTEKEKIFKKLTDIYGDIIKK